MRKWVVYKHQFVEMKKKEYWQICWCLCWVWLEEGEEGESEGLWNVPQAWRCTVPVHKDQEESWTNLSPHTQGGFHESELCYIFVECINTAVGQKYMLFCITCLVHYHNFFFWTHRMSQNTPESQHAGHQTPQSQTFLHGSDCWWCRVDWLQQAAKKERKSTSNYNFGSF